MIMRSLLFSPGISEKKMTKGIESEADCLLIDLEDSVAAPERAEARKIVADFLNTHRETVTRPALFVRINPLDTKDCAADLDAVMTARPDGIMVPKTSSGADADHLSARLAVLEAINGIEEGATKIIAIGGETAAGIFGLGTYKNRTNRLVALTWGPEDLAADIGAQTNRDEAGILLEPYRIARSLCIFGAASANLQAVDTIHANFRDLGGLRKDCIEGAQFGFTGKMAIHPAQVPVINEAYTPSDEAIEHAKRVIEAFEKASDTGVTSLDGEMLDMPHLKRAHSILGRIKKG